MFIYTFANQYIFLFYFLNIFGSDSSLKTSGISFAVRAHIMGPILKHFKFDFGSSSLFNVLSALSPYSEHLIMLLAPAASITEGVGPWIRNSSHHLRNDT